MNAFVAAAADSCGGGGCGGDEGGKWKYGSNIDAHTKPPLPQNR